MRFRLLGPVDMLLNGDVVATGPPQRRAVLAAMLADVGSAVSVEVLIDRVWGDRSPPEARTALYSHIARIRRLVDEARRATGVAAEVRRHAGSYEFAVDPDRVDLHRFRRTVAAARAPQALAAPRRAALLREALDLWDGPALGGVAGPWADVLRESLTRQREDALTLWAETEVALGHPDAVVDELWPLVEGQAPSEPLTAVLMRALASSGRAADALRLYATVRRRLAEDLGVDPGPGLQEVHRSLLRGEIQPVPVAAPPTQPPAGPPSQLPGDVRGFTGRWAELAALDGMPGVASVCVVCGMAGVGKTTLALRWAHAHAGRFPDGQLYIDLQGYDERQVVTAADALAAFLPALGVPGVTMPSAEAERAAMFRTMVAGKRMLVVLDNARDAAQVRPLLPGAASCFTIVTSRDSLAGLVVRDGARRLVLEPPGTDDAVGILHAVAPAPVDADRASAVLVTDRCARLPLALCIAAEHLLSHPGTTTASLAKALADEQRRLDILDAGGDPRSAVRAVFSWSYGLLTPADATAFRLLGAQPALDLDLPAVAALVGVPESAARGVLGRLGAAHLVQGRGAGRYGMHDLLRDFTRELALAGEAVVAVRRLAEHYLAIASSAMDLLAPNERHLRPVAGTAAPRSFADIGNALSWLDDNRANMVAVILAATRTGPPQRSPVFALAQTIWRYLETGAHHAEALSAAGALRQTGIEHGEREQEAVATRYLAVIHGRCGRFEEAVTHARRALQVFEELNDPINAARAHNNLGAFTSHLRRCEEASEHLRRALDIYTRLGERAGVAVVLGNLAGLYNNWRRYPEAIAFGLQALDRCAEVNDRAGMGRALGNLGMACEWLGRYDEALDYSERALAAFRESGVRGLQARALAKLASVYRRLGRVTDALRIGAEALTAATQTGDRDTEIAACEVLGAVFEDSGDVDAASAHYTRGLSLAVEAGERATESSLRSALGGLLLARGDRHAAVTHFADALAVARDINDPLAEAAATDGLARLAWQEGRRDAALRGWRKALACYSALGVPHEREVQIRLQAALSTVDESDGTAKSPLSRG